MAIGTIGKRNEEIPGSSSKGASKADKMKAFSSFLGGVEDITNAVLTASDLKRQSAEYLINADLAERDGDEAINLAMKNVAIVNIERARAKSEVKSSAAGSGFAVSSDMFADRVAANEAQYRNTMAEIVYEGEMIKNAKMFEAENLKIESEYMKDIASITSLYGSISGAANLVGGVALNLKGEK